jgi:hypothetical protein
MDISITAASPEDASEILALQTTAYQSEPRLYNDWTIPPLTQTLPQLVAEFETRILLKAVEAGRIVGSARASCDSGTCFVGRVIVAFNISMAAQVRLDAPKISFKSHNSGLEAHRIR